MTHPLRILLAGCVLAVFLGTPAAKAEAGRIAFSGVIVMPTCAVNGASAEVTQSMQSSPRSTSREFTCGNPGAPAGSGGSYSVTVTALGVATKSDRLLDYFAGYVALADPGNPSAKLVTQTFN